MTRAKRHHTVPKFYLRRFADEGGTIERIGKTTSDRQLIPVKRATVEVDFYTVETDDGPSDIIEQHLSKIESLAASALRRLDRGDEPTQEGHQRIVQLHRDSGDPSSSAPGLGR